MVNGAGSAIADSEATARHLYTDHEYDPESALTYMGARYYDPAVGRFLERDPVLLGAGPTEPQSINAYAYSLNRPTVVSDPTGRTPIGWCSGRGCLNLPSTSITLSTQRDKRREQKSKLADMVAWLNGEMQHMGEGMLVAEMANTDAQVAFQREYPVTAGIMAGVSLAPLVALGIAEAAPAAFGWALANPGTIAAGGTVAEGLAYAAAGVPGPAAPVASIERSIAGRWARGTFATAADSIAYHFAKHGGARTLGQYTDDGARFFAENRGLAQWGKWNPRWEESFRLKLGEQGGYFTADGRILSYWDDVK
jgi:RHS repeat-associated protein